MITFLITAFVTFTFGLERPNLCIAQGLVESGMNQYVTGGKGKPVGAFQVIQRYWGTVPRGTFNQARQNERIMGELILQNEGNIMGATRQYNGDGYATISYAKKVRQTALELELLYVSS